MHRWMLSCLAAVLVCTATWAETPAVQQSDRRDRMFPELVVESGGRRGTCDALAFTRDGQHLLAVGDDKVVRVWEYRDGRIDSQSMKTLRWSIWGAQRGAIYALAVSPIAEAPRIAIGGLGVKTTAAAVIDRPTGETLSTIYADDYYEAPTKAGFQSVRAIAFSPSGKRIAFGSADGSVWLWRPEAKGQEELKWLGKHSSGKTGFNLVRLLHFLNEEKLLSAAQNGEVFQWDLAAHEAGPQQLKLFEDVGREIHDVALSPDARWLAARATKGAYIYVRSFDGQRKDIKPAGCDLLSGLAFSPSGEHLAVGARSRVPDTGNFYLWSDDRVLLYDLAQNQPAVSAVLSHAGSVDVLAFHPDGKHLAVAGGDNHEVTLWDLSRKKRSNVLYGVGHGIWNVALSQDDSHLAFQIQRDSGATHPNHRGRGAWRIFDLEGCEWVSTPAAFTPSPKWEEQGGWRIEPKDSYTWCVANPELNIRHELPWDRNRQGLPRCYAFLPQRKGQPVRLAVGHYHGVSIFKVTPEGVSPLWWGMGHEGEVLSLAVSKEGDWLVSASNDQTIAGWGLESLGRSELGARFRSEEGRVFVAEVDLFSPAWEAGLQKNDEIVQLKIDRDVIFRSPTARQQPAAGSTEACLKALEAPQPLKPLIFTLKRGRDRWIDTFTTLAQRPLWRFFPTQDKEWVLWMPGHHYYDSSNNGDEYIGWQMNNVDPKKTPSFYQAKQFHEVFRKPFVITKLLDRRARNSDPGGRIQQALKKSVAALVPPKFTNFDSVSVRIEPLVQTLKEARDVEVTLAIEPRTQNPDYLPVRAELWINDHRLKVWEDLDGKPLRIEYLIKRDKLRLGDNELTLQCYNRVQGRGEGRLEASARIHCEGRVSQRRLHGLLVGINDYSRSVPAESGKRLENLNTPLHDMEAIRKAWESQRASGFYTNVEITLLPEKDHKADRHTILKELRQLATEAGADDQVLVFLAGHGIVLDPAGERTFVFCCPNFDERNAETYITARELYKELADIRCRKVVFLDVCHSGEVVQPVRDLTPGGRGPTILAACDRGESSWEPLKAQRLKARNDRSGSARPGTDRKPPDAKEAESPGHSFFVAALLEAFERADQDQDGLVDAREIFAYTFNRVPELLSEAQLNVTQTPSCFPRPLERHVLLKRTPPSRK